LVATSKCGRDTYKVNLFRLSHLDLVLEIRVSYKNLVEVLVLSLAQLFGIVEPYRKVPMSRYEYSTYDKGPCIRTKAALICPYYRGAVA
jgi:hypothetical protein